MKLKLKDIDKKWKEYALAGCVCIVFAVVLLNLGNIFADVNYILSFFKPVLLGAIFAYVIWPLVIPMYEKVFKNIKRDSLRRNLAVISAVIIIIAFISLLMGLLIPQLIDNAIYLSENVNSYISNLQNRISHWQIPDYILEHLNSYLENNNVLQKIGQLLTKNLRSIASITTYVGSKAANILIGIIIAIYFLMAKDGIFNVLKKFLVAVLSPLSYKRTNIILEKFNAIFSKYIVCELFDSLIIGILNYIGMAIFAMPSRIFISFIAAVTNLVPTFGPVIGCGISCFLLLLMKPSAIIPYILITIVLQSLDSVVIKPKLFGDALDVPGVMIFIAIIVFGKMFGVPGMLLAIPIAAIIVYIYNEIFIPWLELKKDLKMYIKASEKEKKSANKE